ncbi:PAS domain S-box-containing protein [Pedobacter cryoconitis]|uniref:PAS domain-containing protein n=1 Tax=Pedobacter cryoconitis TaxID=188932 RepID=UPI00161E597E|nr:PAS domain-containing protein [Pedobacter cryoconitis]MBB6270627.1 PAS domain S-box-containing protein [Pedobacter cryoconitis]
MKKYLNLFQNAPVAIAMLDAKTLRLDSANPAMLQLWRREKSVLGRKLTDFLPEIAEQPYHELIYNVIRTGRSYSETGAKFYTNHNGRTETIFVDYSYTPILGKDSKVVSILVVGMDVSERELSRQYMQESDRNLRAMVMSAPVAMAVFSGFDFQLQSVNEKMLDLWSKTSRMGLRELQHVYHNGISFTSEYDQICYSYTPLRDIKGNTTGVVMIGNRKE